MPPDRSSASIGSSSKPAPRPRSTTACLLCRRKKVRCDGAKPTCAGCALSGQLCSWDTEGDRRKPFTKKIRDALELRIATLESELNQLRNPPSLPPTRPSSPSMHTPPTHAPAPSAFCGGLAFNSHRELRFAGPTSDLPPHLAPLSSVPAQLLTHAPDPSTTPLPVPPGIPRELLDRILCLAFDHGLAFARLVPRKAFFENLLARPNERTHHYSPFLLNAILAIGCRYLDEDETLSEVCKEDGGWDTRGDVFSERALAMLVDEHMNPLISTIRALLILAVYATSSGREGPGWFYAGMSIRLALAFGMQLGIHRLAEGVGGVDGELIEARKICFWSIFIIDVLLSMRHGRTGSFPAEHIDVELPTVSPEVDASWPSNVTSAFRAESKLMLIGARIMAAIYTPDKSVSVRTRAKALPELNLELERWYHDLPSHLRAFTHSPGEAPESHIICLNATYYMMMILLHRPFIRRDALASDTHKCVVAVREIVRLVKLQKSSAGLACVPPHIHQPLLTAGTFLALLAFSDVAQPPASEEARLRREQAERDLRLIIDALKEIGQRVWRTASTGADILEGLVKQWGGKQPSSSVPSTQKHAQRQDRSQQEHSASVPFPPEAADAVTPTSSVAYSSDTMSSMPSESVDPFPIHHPPASFPSTTFATPYAPAPSFTAAPAPAGTANLFQLFPLWDYALGAEYDIGGVLDGVGAEFGAGGGAMSFAGLLNGLPG